MSETATSVLNGMVSDGVVRVADVGLRGMITVRGNLASTMIKNAATGVSGVDFPGQGEANCVDEKGILWMSPDELMVMCPYAARDTALHQIKATLAGEHCLVADVSDARALFYLSGPEGDLRDTLAKLTPADVSPRALAPGRFRRTRLAQIPAAFWFRDPETVELIVFRSVARYAFDVLSNAGSTPVGHFEV